MNKGSDNKTIHIVFCIDNNFAVHLGVLITSILHHYTGQALLHFHVISSELDEVHKEQLNKQVDTGQQLSFYTVEPGLSDSWGVSSEFSQRWSVATYYRFLLPWLLPDSVEKVIFFDADMLCLQDISGLYRHELNGKIAGVVDDAILTKQQRWQALELNESRYFNAGFMLIDLNLWRQRKVSGQCMALLQSGKTWRFNDQDILNIVLDGELDWMEQKWNVQTHNIQKDPGLTDVAVIHYTGDEKPWHISSEHPFTSQYLHYKSLSVYANEPLIHYLDQHDRELIEALKSHRDLKVVIYGAGHKGRRLYAALSMQCPNIDVVGFIDRARKKDVAGIPVYPDLTNVNFDLIAIASLAYRQEIYQQLCQQGVEQNKII